MTLFKEMTKCASSEFGIRFFILKSPTKTLSVLKTWTTDSNQHVRRLVSEGSRPRLPWAMSLPMYIKEPAPVIGLLELLKDDDKEYVRRSVANSLNDISKDHPELVAKIATQWMKGASKEREKLVRHACRTLLKSGNQKALRVFGYKPPIIQQTCINILTPEVVFGSALQFTVSLCSNSENDQALMIDYIIHRKESLFMLRTRLASVANIASKIGSFLLFSAPILALVTRAPSVALLNILGAFLVLGFGIAIHLITLPVELDASFNKALPILKKGYVSPLQLKAARKILKAAAFTYVAASMSSLLNFWRWLMVLRR